jgi:uncharacterized small protein (DUF1192 family)
MGAEVVNPTPLPWPSEWLDELTIAGIVRRIDEANERIGTLAAEVRRLQAELVAIQAQRDDAQAKVFHYQRIGW